MNIFEYLKFDKLIYITEEIFQVHIFLIKASSYLTFAICQEQL